MTGKQRLSASIDTELLRAAQTAVDKGRASSVSAWVNDALRLKAEHDRRMDALDSFLAAYEAQHGVITETEIDEAVRRAQSRATVVRSAPDRTAKTGMSQRGVS
jgi:Arc/MetJ-type ribon-helix-helix transcriptional regulator